MKNSRTEGLPNIQDYRDCKVLLVSVPFRKRVREPIGLTYIAASLRANGFEVKILYDANMHTTLEEFLKTSEPYDVIGFSTTTPSFPLASKMALWVKEYYPQKKTVIGGYHSTFCHDDILKDHPEFDVIVRGEGDFSLVEYLELKFGKKDITPIIPGVTYREGQQIIKGPNRPLIKDLDSIPPPALDLIHNGISFKPFYDHHKGEYVTKISLISSRGCYGNCTFCSITEFYGTRKVRCHSIERVIDDVENAVSKFGVGCIQFSDDHFLSSLKRSENILRGIKDRGLDVVFKISSRVDQILRAEKHLPRFFDLGLRLVEVGVENFSQSTLDTLGKGLTAEQSVRAIELLRKNNLRFIIDFILLTPWISFNEIEENLSYIKKLPPSTDLTKLIFSRLQLLPGTALYERAIQEKLYYGDPKKDIRVKYKYPDVEEVDSFLYECRRAGNKLEDFMGDIILEHSKSDERLITSVEYNESGEKVQIDPKIRRFIYIQKNKISVNLLDKILQLKKQFPEQKMPTEQLANIKADYLKNLNSLNDLKNNFLSMASKEKIAGE